MGIAACAEQATSRKVHPAFDWTIGGAEIAKWSHHSRGEETTSSMGQRQPICGAVYATRMDKPPKSPTDDISRRKDHGC